MTDSPIKNERHMLPAVQKAGGSFGELRYENGVVYWTFGCEKVLIDLAVIQEVIAAANKVTKNTKSPMLIDFSNVCELVYTPTARAMLMGADFTRMRTSLSVLNSQHTLTANILLTGNNKFNLPFKMFINREEAQDWLRTFILN